MKNNFILLLFVFLAQNLFSQKSETVLPIKYDSIISIASGKVTSFIDGIKSETQHVSLPTLVELYKDGEQSFFDMSSKKFLKKPEVDDNGEILGFRNGIGIFEHKGHYFYIDPTGRKINPKRFDSLSRFSDFGLGIAENGNREYIIDKKGEIVFETKEGQIKNATQGFVLLGKNEKTHIVDYEGKTLVPFPILKIYGLENGDFLFNTEKGIGALTSENEWVDMLDFKSIKPMDGGFFYFEKENTKGFLSDKYEILTTFDSHQEAENGLYYLEKARKWAIADTNGVRQTGFVYDVLKAFGKNNLLTIATIDGKDALVTMNGKALSGFVWNKISQLEGRKWANAELDYYNQNLIDSTGKPLFELHTGFVSVWPVTDNLFKATDSFFNEGVVDAQKNTLIPFEYENIEPFDHGVAQASREVVVDGKRKTQMGFLTLEGDFVDLSSSYQKPFYKGYSILERDSLNAVMDSTLKFIIQFEKGFTEIKGPNEGLFLVRDNGLYGYFDTKGNKVIDFQYYAAKPFKFGKAAVNHSKYIDKKGKTVESIIHFAATKFDNGLFAVRDGDWKWGIANLDEGLLISYKYDKVEEFIGGFLLVEKNEKFGLVDIEEKEVAEPIYELIQSRTPDSSPYEVFLLEMEGKEEFLFVEDGRVKNREAYDKITKIKEKELETSNLYLVEKDDKFGIITLKF